MTTQRGIRERLGRLFALQLAVISLATIIGIFLTQLVVEDLLTRQALEAEAEHFWSLFDADQGVAMPNTANLTGYLARTGSPFPAPEVIANTEVGYHSATAEGRTLLLHVTERDEHRLMLAFEMGQVSDLAFYFGLLPLTIVLLLMYVILFVAYRWSHRAMLPLVRLAERLEETDLDTPGGSGALKLDDLRADADAEVAAMIDALGHYTARLEQAIERERNFTRDAGHELRTPVAIFKGSLDLMEKAQDRSPADGRALQRMRRTIDDMEALLESLLLLAREETERLPVEACNVNLLLRGQIDSLSALAAQNGNRVALVEEAEMILQCPPRLLEVVTRNLIRNALLYTQSGEITVKIGADRRVTVTDTGKGMSTDQIDKVFESFYRADESRGEAPGHGLGLPIVRRIVQQLGWRITLTSELNRGTTATVDTGRSAA